LTKLEQFLSVFPKKEREDPVMFTRRYTKAFYCAIENDRNDVFELLLTLGDAEAPEEKQHINNYSQGFSTCPSFLLAALLHKATKTCAILARFGARLRDEEKATAVGHAIQGKHDVKCVMALIKYGAIANMHSLREAMRCALIDHNALDFIPLLVNSGARINAQDRICHDMPPVINAAISQLRGRANQNATIKRLVECGANINLHGGAMYGDLKSGRFGIVSSVLHHAEISGDSWWQSAQASADFSDVRKLMCTLVDEHGLRVDSAPCAFCIDFRKAARVPKIDETRKRNLLALLLVLGTRVCYHNVAHLNVPHHVVNYHINLQNWPSDFYCVVSPLLALPTNQTDLMAYLVAAAQIQCAAIGCQDGVCSSCTVMATSASIPDPRSFIKASDPITVMRIARARAHLRHEQLMLIGERAIAICTALQHLRLPALVLVTLLDASFPILAQLVPFHLKWRIATAVKHYRQKNKKAI
jgi:hypothetical protein